MKSALPKVAHRILGIPLVCHVTAAVRAAGIEQVVVVTGHGADVVESLLADEEVSFARQDVQHGTGHAVMCATDSLEGLDGSLVVLAGDCPLFTPETISALVEERERTGAAAVVLTARLDDPTGYGRIVRDDAGRILGIVEHKDLEASQLGITEVNTGTYCFDARVLFAHLERLENTNAQGEYYLTDMVALLREQGLVVASVEASDATETLGINTRVQLAEASTILQKRINRRHMLEGVTMTDPALVWIAPGVEIGRETVIEPMTSLMGVTSAGPGCVLGPNARIVDSRLGAGCVVEASIVEGVTLGDGTTVGPWERLTQDGEIQTAG